MLAVIHAYPTSAYRRCGKKTLTNIDGLMLKVNTSQVVEDISGAPLTQSRGVSDLCRWFAPELLMGQAVLTTSTDMCVALFSPRGLSS